MHSGLCVDRNGCATCLWGDLTRSMSETTEPHNIDEGCAVASYVATVSSDLANMARGTGLETLGYLLEMVRMEAENLVRNGQNESSR